MKVRVCLFGTLRHLEAFDYHLLIVNDSYIYLCSFYIRKKILKQIVKYHAGEVASNCYLLILYYFDLMLTFIFLYYIVDEKKKTGLALVS